MHAACVYQIPRAVTYNWQQIILIFSAMAHAVLQSKNLRVRLYSRGSLASGGSVQRDTIHAKKLSPALFFVFFFFVKIKKLQIKL